MITIHSPSCSSVPSGYRSYQKVWDILPGSYSLLSDLYLPTSFSNLGSQEMRYSRGKGWPLQNMVRWYVKRMAASMHISSSKILENSVYSDRYSLRYVVCGADRWHHSVTALFYCTGEAICIVEIISKHIHFDGSNGLLWSPIPINH